MATSKSMWRQILDAASTTILRRPYGVAGGFALVVGFFLTLLVAFSSGSDKQPNSLQSALLAIITGLLQLAGAWLFARQGRTGHVLNVEAHAIALRTLLGHVNDITELRERAESAVDLGTPAAAKEAVQRASVALTIIESAMQRNVQDWASLAPQFDREGRDIDGRG